MQLINNLAQCHYYVPGYFREISANDSAYFYEIFENFFVYFDQIFRNVSSWFLNVYDDYAYFENDNVEFGYICKCTYFGYVLYIS